VAVLAIKDEATLLVVPGKTGEAPFDGRDGDCWNLANWCSEVRQLKPDQLRVGAGACAHGIAPAEWVRPMAAAPAPKVLPVGRVGLIGVFGCRGFGVVARGINKAIKGA
jgi:hypothetical protein